MSPPEFAASLAGQAEGGALRVSETSAGSASGQGLWLRHSFSTWLAPFETWAAGLAILAIFALNRTYDGIMADALFYVGRGLADLDPDGVGRDLLFREDGQSAFTVYRALVAYLIPHLGPGRAALLLAALGLLAWIAALALLSQKLATGRTRIAILLMVAFLPFGYGAFGVFSYAEPLAVPRPFAEAAVLMGLAALVARRNLVALASMAIAALFHPIMALAGFGVAFLILCFENKLWLAAGAVLVAGALAAGAFGLPLVSRVYEVLDAQWLGILLDRHPYLFPTRWPLEAYTPMIVQATTIGIAASLAEGRIRALLWATLAVAFLGLSASVIFGDWLHLVLIVQVQPWRATWLVAALGAVSLALCAGELWRRGGAFRLAYAMLVVAWAYAPLPAAALCACVLAIALFMGARSGRIASLAILRSAWLATGALLALYEIAILAGIWRILGSMPPDAIARIDGLRATGPQLIPAAMLLAIWTNTAWLRLRGPYLGIAAVTLAALAASLWDDRAPLTKLVEANGPPSELTRLVGSTGDEVLFLPGRLDADLPWLWLHSPNWGAEVQGTSLLFSRSLALFWRERIGRLISLGLLDQTVLAPHFMPWRKPIPTLTRKAVETLCGLPDAPRTILAALHAGNGIPAGISGAIFQLPAPQFAVVEGGTGISWQRIDAYAVIKCAEITSQLRPPFP